MCLNLLWINICRLLQMYEGKLNIRCKPEHQIVVDVLCGILQRHIRRKRQKNIKEHLFNGCRQKSDLTPRARENLDDLRLDPARAQRMRYFTAQQLAHRQNVYFLTSARVRIIR